MRDSADDKAGISPTVVDLLRQRVYGSHMTNPKATQTPPKVLHGRTLRMMREAHQIGLREMAQMAEVSPSHLARVESGERGASSSLTERLYELLATLPAPERESA